MENEKFQTPSWLEELRKEFPVTEKWAYFDSAYETGGAHFLEEASRKYFADKSDFYPGILQMGGSGKGKAIDLIEKTRTLLAEFLNARDGHSIAFTANTCQAVALALQSYPFEPGDNVVVGDIEHVCVLYPVISLKQRGVEVRLVHPETEWGLTAEKLLEQVDDHTRFVVVSYVQSASGYRIDLEKLVTECHKKNCYVVTDAIQLLGFRKMDVKALGVDAVAASGYKGLLSIEGGGFLYVADSLLEKLRPWSAGPNPALVINRENGTWTCKDELDARKLEAGTLPFHTIYCLHESLQLLKKIGMDEISGYVEQCYQYVSEGLKRLGYQIDTPEDHHCHSMLVVTEEKEEMADYFQQKGIFFTAGHGNHVRLAVAPFTSEEDMKKLLAAAAEWKSRL